MVWSPPLFQAHPPDGPIQRAPRPLWGCTVRSVQHSGGHGLGPSVWSRSHTVTVEKPEKMGCCKWSKDQARRIIQVESERPQPQLHAEACGTHKLAPSLRWLPGQRLTRHMMGTSLHMASSWIGVSPRGRNRGRDDDQVTRTTPGEVEERGYLGG